VDFRGASFGAGSGKFVWKGWGWGLTERWFAGSCAAVRSFVVSLPETWLRWVSGQCWRLTSPNTPRSNRHREQAQATGTGNRHRQQAQASGSNRLREQAQATGTGNRHKEQARGSGTSIRHRHQAQTVSGNRHRQQAQATGTGNRHR